MTTKDLRPKIRHARIPTTMKLKCVAIKCRRKVEADKLLCERHWLVVPKYLKVELVEKFRPGRDTLTGKMSPDFRKVISKVVHQIADQEGLTVEADTDA